MTTIAKFEAGHVYWCRSICDSDCVFSFKVMKRTDKTVWLKDRGGKIKARRVRISGQDEVLDPLGVYSMSPVLRASQPE